MFNNAFMIQSSKVFQIKIKFLRSFESLGPHLSLPHDGDEVNSPELTCYIQTLYYYAIFYARYMCYYIFR